MILWMRPTSTGAPAARTLAIVHVSMADAVNTVQNRYTRYAYRGTLQLAASPEAAAASAARSALVTLFPAQRTRIEEAYAATTRIFAKGPGWTLERRSVEKLPPQ